MNTYADSIKTISRPLSLSKLALAAGRELDSQLDPPVAEPSRTALHALAERLRQLFPGDRPNIPSDSLGLICGVVQSYGDATRARGLFERSTLGAKRIAELLDAPQHTQEEIAQLIDFCISFHRATEPLPHFHDIPEDHEGFVSMR
jgi:hypothetical protein